MSRTLVLFLSALMFITGIRAEHNLSFLVPPETTTHKEQTDYLLTPSDDLVCILNQREEKVSSSLKDTRESEKKQQNLSNKFKGSSSSITPPLRSQTEFCFPYITMSLSKSDLIFPFHNFW